MVYTTTEASVKTQLNFRTESWFPETWRMVGVGIKLTHLMSEISSVKTVENPGDNI